MTRFWPKSEKRDQTHLSEIRTCDVIACIWVTSPCVAVFCAGKEVRFTLVILLEISPFHQIFYEWLFLLSSLNYCAWLSFIKLRMMRLHRQIFQAEIASAARCPRMYHVHVFRVACPQTKVAQLAQGFVKSTAVRTAYRITHFHWLRYLDTCAWSVRIVQWNSWCMYCALMRFVSQFF